MPNRTNPPQSTPGRDRRMDGWVRSRHRRVGTVPPTERTAPWGRRPPRTSTYAHAHTRRPAKPTGREASGVRRAETPKTSSRARRRSACSWRTRENQNQETHTRRHFSGFGKVPEPSQNLRPFSFVFLLFFLFYLFLFVFYFSMFVFSFLFSFYFYFFFFLFFFFISVFMNIL